MDFDLSDMLVASGFPVDVIEILLGKYTPERGSWILEAGAGTGKIGTNIAARTHCVTVLVDNDDKQLERMMRLVAALEALLNSRLPVLVRKADILKLPFRDGMFDLVFNEGVIEHFLDPLVPLREMARVSCDAVACWVPNALNEIQVQQAKEQTQKHAGQEHWAAYEKPMTLKELKALFEAAGLKDIQGGLVMPDSNWRREENFRLVFAVGRKA